MSLSRSVVFRVVCICLLPVMTATTLRAAENNQELTLAVTDKTVEVFARDGRPIQSLPFGGETPDEYDREYFAIAEDMNFDDFPDVRVLYSRGTVNVYYDCWLWRPEENAFVRRDDMQGLSNPVFDQAAKTIHVYERGSALCHVEGTLVWENGDPVWVAITVKDEADDGENIVVRRYLRDGHGELRLTDERLFHPGGPEGEKVGAICLPPESSGLNLVLDSGADPLDAAMLPNGEWWLRQRLPDGTMLIESRRLPPLEYDRETPLRLIRAEWPLARDIEVAPFPALAEKTTYPALKVEFLNGENEDTRQFAAALVFTDEWSFWFVLDASADAELSPEDGTDAAAFAQGERLKKDMETALLGVKTADSAEGCFPPGFIPALHFADPDSTLPTGVMDALIRIKKTVGPEYSKWRGPGAHAYRYDGPETVAGKPALRFSFGADTLEKFTAERHFAVDGEGTVYEMDIPAGGEYGSWNERGALWRGEYRRGDTVLRIHDYREGPFGMYLIFAFTAGEKVVFEGTVPARGRTARHGRLVFSLAGDDKTVTVTTDSEASDDEAAAGLEGVYKAA